MENKRGLKRVMTGEVVSNKMAKTVVVEIKQRVKHKRYPKYINRTARFKAHDEKNQCKVGDLVVIVESRPISKDKKWAVKTIKETNKNVDVNVQ